MPTRLLSFLTDIEKALVKESASNMGPTYDVSRMVSYHQGLARMTLTPQAGAEPAPGGTLFLQSFLLSDGSPCLKANLSWEGSTASTVVAVYSKPQLDWRVEAARIASLWLAGAPPSAESAPEAGIGHLAAVAS